jgi:hypothetical protein
MVADFIPNSSRKELLTKFTTLVPTSWEVITKRKNYLNIWNECVAEAKLDDLYANYFAKHKRHQVEEQGISTIVIGKEGRDNGAKSGREQLVYTLSLEKLSLFSNIELGWETK